MEAHQYGPPRLVVKGPPEKEGTPYGGKPGSPLPHGRRGRSRRGGERTYSDGAGRLALEAWRYMRTILGSNTGSGTLEMHGSERLYATKVDFAHTLDLSTSMSSATCESSVLRAMGKAAATN